MVRLLAAILITCFFTAQLSAQATKDEAPKDQPLAAQTAAPASAAAPSAKTGFPFDAFPEFSAVMAGSMSPNDTRESYIYRSGNLIRNEGLGDHSYLITNLATHESFGVATTGCIHDSHPYFRSAPLASIAPGDKAVRVDAGEETIDGHSCKIEDVTITGPKLLRPIQLRFWEAEDMQGFPIQVEFRRLAGHNSVIHYTNVVVGPQDPTLFIYPNSCEKSLGFKSKIPVPPPGVPKKEPAGAPAATPPN